MNTEERPVSSTTLYRKKCNRETLMAFYTNFATEFLHTVFTRRSVLKELKEETKSDFLQKSHF